jgi:leucine dehydrogenase
MRLQEHGILYAPDYVINAGGLISAVLEMGLEDEASMLARIDAIGERLLQIYESARDQNASTLSVAEQMVQEKLR